MARIFLKDNHSEEVCYFSVDDSRIETLRESKSYGRWGQTVGTYFTGDSIELLTEKAVEIANKLVVEKSANHTYNAEDHTCAVGDIVNGYDDSLIFDELEEALKSLTEGVDYNLYYTTVKGFNYWNGSNYITVTTSVDTGEETHKVIDDKDLIAELQKAIDEMEPLRNGFGMQEYAGNGFKIIQTQFASDWSEYTLFPIP